MTLMEHIQRYTLTDYAQWTGDWELIQGQPVAMTPSPGVSHQRISLKIARQLDEQLEDCSLVYIGLSQAQESQDISIKHGCIL
ncbi:MAG: Uma2 family endonuclease [Desulfovermiculus sp.]|nr:Uma2 family endonuclease [Desulfovermiculus sp.]